MSQKTNPTSCRLQKTNKHFSSCWYSDFFYTQTSTHDLQIRSYMEQVSEQIGHLQVFSYMINCFRRSHTYLFFLDTRVIQHGREKTLRLRSKLGQKHRHLGQAVDTSAAFLSSYLSFYNSKRVSIETNKNNLIDIKHTVASSYPNHTPRTFKSHIDIAPLQERLGQLSGHLRSIALTSQISSSIQDLARGENTPSPSQQIAVQRRLIKPTFFAFEGTSNPTLFRNSVEKTLDSHSSNCFTIYPIRIMQDIQFAGFLAQAVASILRRGAPFKQVQDKVLNECTGTKNGLIKGIRLSCSGRVGGRSKKAQKSKTQSVQWGETSLHVFSSRLSFASTSANTPFGKIGIKVWLCFKS